MTEKDWEFEEYFNKKLAEIETLKYLPNSVEQLREIYWQEYQAKKNIPVLYLKLEPQPVTYDISNQYLPEKWEMIRPGQLLYDDEELLNVLKLIMFNLGVQKSLDIIPGDLIEQYLRNNEE